MTEPFARSRGAPLDAVHVEPLSGAKGEPPGPTAGMAATDGLLAGLAERQHGVVSRRQLLAAGVGRRAIGARLERGSLRPVQRGVYAVGHAKLSLAGRWMAAVLALGPGALLSHHSAARLWQLIPPSSSTVEITRPRNARPRSGIVVHRAEIPYDERTAVDGIPVTTVPRTILDLAAVAGRRQVERAFNEVEVRQLTDRLSIPDLLDRYPRRTGTAVLRTILDGDRRPSGVTRNDFERRFARLVASRGFPPPRFNADVAVGGRFFEADCVWDEARLIVELDGRAAHGTRLAFESDRERDRLLVANGWRVVRVTWRQLRDDEDALTTDLRRLLGHARRDAPRAQTR